MHQMGDTAAVGGTKPGNWDRCSRVCQRRPRPEAFPALIALGPPDLGHRLDVGQDIDVPTGLLITLEVVSQAAFQPVQRAAQIKVISFGELPGSQLSNYQPAPGR